MADVVTIGPKSVRVKSRRSLRVKALLSSQGTGVAPASANDFFVKVAVVEVATADTNS